MAEKRDKGGALVTDYSKSNLDPERARRLNKAELDYVNGIWDEEAEEWTWPSYPQLAAKYDLPLRLVNLEAARHKWVSRRERRKTEMIAFQNEQTRKRWLDEDRAIMGVLLNNIGVSVATVARLQDEHRRLIEKALNEEREARENGDPNYIARVPIRPSEVEGLIRATETAMKTAEKLAVRISGLPTVLPEVAPPQPIKTVEEEEREREAADRLAAPEETLLEIYKEMAKIEEARNRAPRVIYGELGDDDDESAGS
jgi:hypothetical protein